MSNNIEVVSVNISAEKGTVKTPVQEIELDARGIVGDAHAGRWHRQVSLLGQDSVDRFVARENIKVGPGDFAENITLRGINLNTVSILDRFRIGEVDLEVTQIGKACHGDGCSIYQQVGKCVMPKEGIFCRVLHGGRIRPGDAVEYCPKTLVFKIVTVSDRASMGEYEDRSGPRIRELLEEFLSGKRWHAEIGAAILPDDANLLHAELTSARSEGVDVVFTTGGTGVGPRDRTPEVAREICDRTIPGIMEHIRVKYGSQKPNALLSRGIAGLAKRTLIFTLPGGGRAVEEYVTEILSVLEHLIFMVHGLDNH